MNQTVRAGCPTSSRGPPEERAGPPPLGPLFTSPSPFTHVTQPNPTLARPDATFSRLSLTRKHPSRYIHYSPLTSPPSCRKEPSHARHQTNQPTPKTPKYQNSNKSPQAYIHIHALLFLVRGLLRPTTAVMDERASWLASLLKI